MLDTWALRVLVEVGERGSLSAAAQCLSMTQPAVSRQIAGLERRLGVRLFQREPRGVRPTAAGELAIELAREALGRIHTLESRVRALAGLDGGRLRLSGFSSVNTWFVPQAIREFSRTHPGVELTLCRPDPAGAVQAVRARDVDLALVTEWELHAQPAAAREEPTDGVTELAGGVELIPLLDEELLVAMPASHPLATRELVELPDLRAEEWIDGAFPDCLGPIWALADRLGNAPRVGFHCDDWNGKQALVAASVGIMLVPTLARTTIRPDVVLRPVVPALPPRGLFAAVPVEQYRPAAVSAMLPVLTELAGSAGSAGSAGPPVVAR